jgi:hypothetical protein
MSEVRNSVTVGYIDHENPHQEPKMNILSAVLAEIHTVEVARGMA